MTLPPYKLITSQPDWQACVSELQTLPRFAIDLEANSMYAYRERICLIQISSPTQDYIIDPLSDVDLSPLGNLLANPSIEKIFHAAEYDLTLLKREFDWEVNYLFDTMWAARILGYERYGLANILETIFDVRLNKKYQKSDWCKRPLGDAQLNYAQHDTHFLFALRQHLLDELATNNQLEEASEIFEAQTHVTPSNNEFTADSFWSINGVRDLSKEQQAVLCQINIYRDQIAQQRDLPLFKVLGDKTLVQIATIIPNNSYDLSRIQGMSNGQVRRYGKGLLNAIVVGKHTPPPPKPKRGKRPSDDVLNRYEKLHNWRKLRAQSRGVESDVIISRDALWAIARENPQTTQELATLEEVGDWRCQTYGNEIIELIDEINFAENND